MRIATALLGLLLPVVACAAPMYRIDLRVTEKDRPPDEQPLTMLVEGGKDASMEIGGPDGSRRYEMRVDAQEDAKGRATGTVHLRVVRITPRGERELGRDAVKFERLGYPVAWQPKKRVKGLDIQVTLYRQPF
jgi:hypothetical protein